MNILKEIKLVNKILVDYPEEFILIDNYNLLKITKDAKKHKKEIFLKKFFLLNIYLLYFICKYSFIFIFKKNISHQNKKQFKFSKLSFFVGTFNQYKSLKDLINNFDEKNIYLIDKGHESFIKGSENINTRILNTNKKNFLIMLFFIFTRSKKILKKVIKYPSLNYRFLLSQNIKIYPILANFIEEFHNSKTNVLVLSNSHNRTNICLILVCKLFKIKTAYLQHASITKNFPPLICDFNFLDGNYSFDKYKEIEKTSNIKIKTKRNIFLTGSINSPKNTFSHKKNPREYIGFCIGLRDDIKKVIKDCDLCLKLGYKISLRLHPRESEKRWDSFYEYVSKNRLINLHNAKEKELEIFLEEIFCCLACSSAIQLETALAGIPNLYRDWSFNAIFDRYEFIKNGLCIKSLDNKDFENNINLARIGELSVPKNNIKYYSDTYGAEKFGSEFLAIKENLENIIKGVKPKYLNGYKSFFY